MSSTRERIMRFGPDQRLVGILSAPSETRPGAPHVVFVNAGIVHRVGPNRLYVDLARKLAARGFPVLRFDLSGLGDSASLSTSASVADAAVTDVQSAFNALESSRQAKRFIVAGLCLGANYSFLTATADDRVAGVLAVDPTVARTPRGRLVHLGRRALHLATLRELVSLRHPIWRRSMARLRDAAPELAADQGARPGAGAQSSMPTRASAEAEMQRLIDRGVRLMVVFTGGVNNVYNYREQLFDLLPGLNFRDRLQLEYMPDTDHSVSDRASRATLLAAAESWASAAFPAEAAL